MKEFTKQNVRELSETMMAGLLFLERKYGIKLAYKGGRYTSSNVTFKIEMSTVGANGQAMDRDRQQFILMADYYGMKGTWIDQTFSWCGNTYKVVGLKTRCHKNPVMVERADGKRYKMNVQMIIDAFKLKGLK